jgi:hypothetical protein
MAKTRLRNDDRDAIQNAIIEQKFGPIEASLKSEGEALALKVRARAYGDFVRVIDGAPAGAFPREHGLSVVVDGKRVALPTSGPLLVFYTHRNAYNEMLSVSDADPMGARIMDWAERKEKARSERRKLASQVAGTLAAFRTFDDLQRGWPEADAFITARWRTRPEYAANVPAVQISALTAALDLPPGEQSEAA